MNWIQQITSAITQIFKWWFIVQPWEQSIRVRFGKRVRCFEAGIHTKIPFFDRVYIQNVRKRYSIIQPQTITTTDGKTITVCGSLRYRIDDVLKLYTNLHQPEDTICQEVEAMLTQYIIARELSECQPVKISEHIASGIDMTQYGLCDVEFFITDFAVVRTYRLINGDLRRYIINGRQLETNNHVQSVSTTGIPY